MQKGWQQIHLDHTGRPWIALTARDTGILARAVTEDGKSFTHSLRLSLNMASSLLDLLLTQQSRTATQDREALATCARTAAESENLHFECSVWRRIGNNLRVLSCGTISVLKIDNSGISEIIRPHSAFHEGREKGLRLDENTRFYSTQQLGKDSRGDMIRLTELYMGAAKALIFLVDPRLAQLLVSSRLQTEDITNFIDSWQPNVGRAERTYILLNFNTRI
mgnify:CR=1 FL=1